jgi:hypothetical protein
MGQSPKLTHGAEAWEQFINKPEAEDDISYMERLAHTGNVHKVPYETGPGLKGLFDRKTLPASGRPVAEEDVRQQIRDPHEKMPSFANRLTDDERDKIVAYLKIL